MYEIRHSNTEDNIEFSIRNWKYFCSIDFKPPFLKLTPSAVFKLMELLHEFEYIENFICAGYSCLVEGEVQVASLCDFIEKLNIKENVEINKNSCVTHSIPICYDESFGFDLKEISDLTGVGVKEIIGLHKNGEYTVQMTGFLPGFIYLTGLDTRLHVKRKNTPDHYIPKSSLGIAHQYTGIYPSKSPGGWYIIGRSPLDLIKPFLREEVIIKVGDKVKFKEISLSEFYALKEDQEVCKPDVATEGQATLLEVGIQTTIQDQGRQVNRTYGVQKGGSMNKYLANLANWLLGNKVSDAVLEGALKGIKIRFHQPTVISIVGLGMNILINEMTMDGNVFSVKKNDILDISCGPNQTYFYVGVKWGWGTREVMGSKSTNYSLGIGILTKDSILNFSPFTDRIKEKSLALCMKTRSLSFLPGPEYDLLTKEQKAFIQSGVFEKSPQSNRMGISLKAEQILCNSIQLNSTPVIPGIIQLTPDGQLIVLMYDCQTIGGYPRVGYLTEDCRDQLALLPPNSIVSFD